MANRRKTRNFFPLPNFQVRFLGLLVGGAVVQVSLTCFILFFFIRQNYLLLVRYAALDEQITNVLYRELRFMVAAIGVTFLAYLFGLTLIGIVFSHRIAGPIHEAVPPPDRRQPAGLARPPCPVPASGGERPCA